MSDMKTLRRLDRGKVLVASRRRNISSSSIAAELV